MEDKLEKFYKIKNRDEKRKYVSDNMTLEAEILDIKVRICIAGNFGKTFKKEIPFRKMISAANLLEELTKEFQKTFIEILYDEIDGGRSISSIQFLNNFVKIDKEKVNFGSETLIEDFLKE